MLLYAKTEKFDIVLIDAWSADVYPPILVERIRKQSGTESKTLIAAVAEMLMPEFDGQLKRAGADMVLLGPQKLRRYLQRTLEAVRKRNPV